jgi:LPXTG-site transpeptidase (sortase) family protein
MKKVLIEYKDLLLIILGGLLFVGGITGLVFVFLPAGQQSTPIAPTGIEVNLTPLSLPTQTQSGLPISATGAEKIQAAPVFSNLNTTKYFVHPGNGDSLEFPLIPDRIVIPSVGIDASVIVAQYNSTKIDGETFGQWEAPDELAAGWHPDSALLGQPGNTVINGHHNEYGEVFSNLVNAQVGDLIYVYSGTHKFSFIIANRMILQERFVDMQTRIQNARWLASSDDTRLTLVTCWPKISNTHRLILVARPYTE